MDKINNENNKIIQIQSLTFEYRRTEDDESIRALNNITLEIKKGDFTAVIGRNGSGKSTLAKNINALLIPTSGTIYVEGYNTADESAIWEIRQRAGMVFQNPDNQLVSAVVEDDIAFGPENLGLDTELIKERVRDSLLSVNMFEKRKMAPHLLSGGQKQRVAIAGVIAMRPDIIIFDEPTAMLDPKGRKEVLSIIRQLNDEGITVVLITHFMEETIHADRLIIMDRGDIAMDGPPTEIFKQAKELEELDLELPFAVDLAERLRAHGMDIPDDILETKDMVNYICQ